LKRAPVLGLSAKVENGRSSCKTERTMTSKARRKTGTGMRFDKLTMRGEYRHALPVRGEISHRIPWRAHCL
jgi:hypothetical protein